MKTTYCSHFVAGMLGVFLGGCADGAPGSESAELSGESTDDRAAARTGLRLETGHRQGLPARFALTGCNLPPVCQGKQLSAGWEATCGQQKIGGAAADALTPFTLADGRVCSGEINHGALKGSCTGGDAGICSFESKSDLLATPYCVELPTTISQLDVCSQAPAGAQQIRAEQCEIVQNECSFQASCSGGQVFAGNVTATGLRWDTAFNYRCTATYENGKLAGTCTQRGVAADAGVAPGSCTLSAAAESASGSCSTELPKNGFVLQGCGHEGTICSVAQRGCIWQATCGDDVYRARMQKPGEYAFNLRSGARCTARVKDGVFAGSCGEGASACTFASTAAAPASGCLTLPPSGLQTTGCGGGLTCDVLQSGCKWQAACSNANVGFVYRGTAKADGVEFAGQNGFFCWADKEAGSTRLIGGCSRSGERVSECSPRVEERRLVLAPR